MNKEVSPHPSIFWNQPKYLEQTQDPAGYQMSIGIYNGESYKALNQSTDYKMNVLNTALMGRCLSIQFNTMVSTAEQVEGSIGYNRV